MMNKLSGQNLQFLSVLGQLWAKCHRIMLVLKTTTTFAFLQELYSWILLMKYRKGQLLVRQMKMSLLLAMAATIRWNQLSQIIQFTNNLDFLNWRQASKCPILQQTLFKSHKYAHHRPIWVNLVQASMKILLFQDSSQGNHCLWSVKMLFLLTLPLRMVMNRTFCWESFIHFLFYF